MENNEMYLFEPIFDECDVFHNGIARVRVNDKWGYIREKLPVYNI